MGCGDAVHGGQGRGGVAARTSWRTRRSPDAEEFRRTGIHWGADQERVGLAEFAADPARHPLRDAVAARSS